MKTTALAAAAFVSLAAIGAAHANSADVADGPNSKTARADETTRVAEGWRFWQREGHGEREGHRGRHHWREDDDDDDDGDHGRGHHARGGAGPADPNPTNAPVPDNGVFTGKARPKVEVQ